MPRLSAAATVLTPSQEQVLTRLTGARTIPQKLAESAPN